MVYELLSWGWVVRTQNFSHHVLGNGSQIDEVFREHNSLRGKIN